MKKKRKKNARWRRPRHRLVRNVASLIFSPVVRRKYGVRVERFSEQGKRPYFILFNHQTAYDQFFVGMAFRGPIYYVASEDLFSDGFVSSLIRYLVAPIPIRKQTTDVRAIMNCIKVAKEGGTIAIAPEGNRTYSGRTGYMSPAVASLAKKLGLPIAIYRIEGGYYVHPRWADDRRKLTEGGMRGHVSRVIEPEEYSSMTDAQLFEIIRRELAVDESTPSAVAVRGDSIAEGLERAMYVCPGCGVSSFTSEGNAISCDRCGWRAELDSFYGITDTEGRFSNIGQWYDYQQSHILSQDPDALTDSPVTVDEGVTLSRVILYKRKEILAEAVSVRLYGDRIELYSGGELLRAFPFADCGAVTLLGKNKCNIYFASEVLQLKGKRGMNALKLVNFFHNYKNKHSEVTDGEFLGL